MRLQDRTVAVQAASPDTLHKKRAGTGNLTDNRVRYGPWTHDLGGKLNVAMRVS